MPASTPRPRRLLLTALAATALLAPALVALTTGQASAAAPPARATVTPAIAHHSTARVCGTAKPKSFSCFAIRQTDAVEPNAVTPNALPSGLSPANLKSAYALDTSRGSGQTVAIVDAYNDPNAAADLATYRSTYGLPACTVASGCFRQVNQNGSTTSLPPNDTGWAGEISLDLDMVSAACPNCKILLVEATSPTTANLGTAVNEAVALGAKFVSNSYGGSETSSETSADSSYYNHPGVAITASTGDGGYGVEYPAASRYVTAVGGTSLVASSSARGWTETAWSGAGSGCSSYETRPTVQSSVANITAVCARRAVADVSAVADPNTGVAVYQTYGGSGWAVYGGTSASSPIIASVYALAGTPAAGTTPNAYPYAHTGNLFDVTSGSNGSCGLSALCTAKTGWDGPTGLGTPNGYAAFVAGSGTSGVTVTNPGAQTTKVGTATSLQLTASGGTGSYTWTVSGLPAGLSATSAGLISGTPTTAGTYSVTATATSGGSSGSATFSWVVSTTSSGCSGQLLGNPGFESGSTVWSSTAGVISNSGEAPHSGTYFAWLDGYGTTHTDTLSQSVTIPASCTATVSFWLHIDTAETTTTTAYDKLTVKLGSTTLATYSNLNASTGYVQKTFSVSSPAGQTAALTFSGTEDSSLQTSFVVDDTAVTLS